MSAAKPQSAIDAIVWSEKTVPVADLVPYERNPRQITRESFFKLKKSLREVGYHQRILATPDLKVIGGHMRIKALRELGIKDIVILVPSRALTDHEYQRVMIQDNVNFGTFDTEMLASDFDGDTLVDWGVPEKLVGIEVEPDLAGAGEGGDGTSSGQPKVCPHCGESLE